jgi:hypothetical protein
MVARVDRQPRPQHVVVRGSSADDDHGGLAAIRRAVMQMMGVDMRNLRRISIGALVAAVSLSLVGAAAAAPKHSVSLTKGKSPYAQFLNIIAGSPSAVVYETGQSWQRGYAANPALKVKTSSGKVRTLKLPKGQVLLSYQNWSLAKNLLVAYSSSISEVSWWKLTGSSHGQSKIPAGYELLGASTNGWLLENETTDVVYNQQAGHHKPTRIGTPFASSPEKGVETATSGSTGAAFRGDSGGLVYLKWGTKKFKTLSFNSAKDTIYECTSLAGGALGCVGAVTGKSGEYILRIPLNGKKLVATKVSAKGPYPTNVSVSSTATAWTSRATTGFTSHFYSTSAKGHGVSTSKHVKQPAGYNASGLATSAFGKFVVVTGTTRSLKLATVTSAASSPKTTVTAALGVVHAASISLSSNRVAYTDNQKDYNAGDVWSRSLSGHSTGSASELIATSATSFGLSISGTTTADSEAITGTGKNAKPHVAIRIGSRIGTVVGSAAQASGSNVLYSNAKGALEIYNGKTRKSSAASLPSGYGSAFLNGSNIDYVEGDGSVWQRALSSSATPRQLAAAPSGYNGSASISASGADVVWSEYVNGVSTVRFCVVTSTTCTVQSAGSTYQLDAATTNGILLVKYALVSSTSSYTFTWVLKPYSSKKSKKVLSQTYSQAELSSSPVFANSPINAQVAVANGRVAWIDPGGTAHIASLP